MNMVPPTPRPSPNPIEPFQISVRVYYEDTDAVGIVYHANYIKFAERARTEYLRASGWDHQKVGKELGIAFVIRNMEISFHAPARIDDLLTASAEVMNCGTTSFTMEQLPADIQGLNVHEYLLKPVNPERLVELVKHAGLARTQ